MHSALSSGHLVAGRYRLVDQIGRGAMGIVWRGRDELLDRDVAVKQIVLSPLTSATEAQASYQRTLREARSAARLSHPGVVTVFDVVEEGGSPWIVMELVRARPLDQVIAEDGPLPPARAAQLGLGLLDALTTAHKAGVLHRDVKPSNVLISPDGKAVLTDFGIATIQGDPGMTQAGMVVGTPGFSPPERVRGAAATPASDLWSLGATLYAAVEGRGPFDRAGGSAAIIASIATEPAPRAPSAGPLGPVIDALLRADPAERPDAATTARMLRQAWRAARTPERFAAGGIAAAEALPAADDPVIPEADGSAAALAASEATTATQVVTVPADDSELRTAASAGAGPAGAAGAAASLGGTDEPQVALAAPANAAGEVAASASMATSVVPDLMATPNFASLKMPDPPSDGLPAGDQRDDSMGKGTSVADGTAPRGIGDFLKSKRGLAILAPLAALAVAAGVIFLVLPPLGLPLYRLGGGSPSRTTIAVAHVGKGTGTRAGQTQRGTTPAGSGGSTGPSAKATPSQSAGHGKHKSGKHKSGKPTHGGTPSTSPKPSSSGSGSPSSSSSSSSPSSSPSTSPSPTPTPTGPSSTLATLPAGYTWFSVSASSAGTIAGFELGAPDTWLMTPGVNTIIKPAAGAAKLSVNMSTWNVSPVKEARRRQAAAKLSGKYPDYHLLSITSLKFDGWPAARWTFWWQPAAALNATEVSALLFRAQTVDGPQEYILLMSAPQPRITWAEKVLHVAMNSFQPLPG
jgi:tRNA A-37 threonylcarbamoyl transferase component Bud32